MDGRALLDLATALAKVSHSGQYRKGTGEPYFHHCERVAGRVYGWRAKTVAYLHDVLEDTNVTFEMLVAIGFPYSLVCQVAALTRHHFGQETYREFIDRTVRGGDVLVLRVKAADLADNLDDIDDLSPGERTSLRSRYTSSEETVLAAIVALESA